MCLLQLKSSETVQDSNRKRNAKCMGGMGQMGSGRLRRAAAEARAPKFERSAALMAPTERPAEATSAETALLMPVRGT